MRNENNQREEIVRYQNTINSNYDDLNEEKHNIDIAYGFDDDLEVLKGNNDRLGYGDTIGQDRDMMTNEECCFDEMLHFDDNDGVSSKKSKEKERTAQVFKKKIVLGNTNKGGKTGSEEYNEINKEKDKLSVLNLEQFKVDPHSGLSEFDMERRSNKNYNTNGTSPDSNMNDNEPIKKHSKSTYQSAECYNNNTVTKPKNNNHYINEDIKYTPKTPVNEMAINYNKLYDVYDGYTLGGNDQEELEGDYPSNKQYDADYEELAYEKEAQRIMDINEKLLEDNESIIEKQPMQIQQQKHGIGVERRPKGTFASLQIKSDKQKTIINKIEASKDIDTELFAVTNEVTDFQKSIYTQLISQKEQQPQSLPKTKLIRHPSCISSTTTPMYYDYNDYNHINNNSDDERQIPQRRKSTDLPKIKKAFNSVASVSDLHSTPQHKQIDPATQHSSNDPEGDNDIEAQLLTKLSKLKKDNEMLKEENSVLIEKVERISKESMNNKSAYKTLLDEYDIIVAKYEELKLKSKQEESNGKNEQVEQIASELKVKTEKYNEAMNKISELEKTICSMENKASEEKNALKENKMSHESLKTAHIDLMNQYQMLMLKMNTLNEENFNMKRELFLIQNNQVNTQRCVMPYHNYNTQQYNNNNTSFNDRSFNSNTYNNNQSFNTPSEDTPYINTQSNQEIVFSRKHNKKIIMNDQPSIDNEFPITDRIKKKNTSQNDSSGVSALLTRNNYPKSNPISNSKINHYTAEALPTKPNETHANAYNDSIDYESIKKKNKTHTINTITNIPNQDLLQKEIKKNQLENEMYNLQSERSSCHDELNKLPEHPKQKAQILRKKNIELQIGELDLKINDYKKELRELNRNLY